MKSSEETLCCTNWLACPNAGQRESHTAGRVKALDFGLARPVENPIGNPVQGSSTSSTTLVVAGTEPGLILGTAGYMAPGQARGKLVDRRADIWAFGVVLFEMLTGEKLFTGETAPEIMASVLKDAPNLHRLPASTPPAVRRGSCSAVRWRRPRPRRAPGSK